VNVHLSDIMTPQSFSTVIATLIKYLVYEKQLIPYPYDRMKLYVEKYNKLNVEQNNDVNQQNKYYRLESDKYYKKVSNAIDTMETVFKCIEREFLSCMENHIETVTIIIGSNIFNPLTVFNIRVPKFSYSHFEQQHTSRKHIDNLFKNILNNDKFNDILTSNIMIEANLYVMFKVKKGEKMKTNWCIPKERFHLLRGNQVVFTFDLPQDVKTKSCCYQEISNFEVFVDIDEGVTKMKPANNDSVFKNNVVEWYLGKYYITGFKNYKFNGIPITDTWLNPKLLTT